MAFNKKTWVNRVVQYPLRRLLTIVRPFDTTNTAVMDIQREDGEVTTEGDAFSATNMNDLESRIESAFEDVIPKVTIMPIPSIDNVGTQVIYIGTTTSDYTKGYTYECQEKTVGTTTIYEWEHIGAGGGGNFVGVKYHASLVDFPGVPCWEDLTSDEKAKFDISTGATINFLDDETIPDDILGDTDISGIADGTLTGAIDEHDTKIAELNADLTTLWDVSDSKTFPTTYGITVKLTLFKSGMKLLQVEGTPTTTLSNTIVASNIPDKYLPTSSNNVRYLSQSIYGLLNGANTKNVTCNGSAYYGSAYVLYI